MNNAVRPAVVVALATTLAVALSGCGGPPATHYYLLEVTPKVEARSTAAERGVTVGVRSFQVDPPYDQDRIVYRVGADSPEVGFYEYHRWAAPLSHMLPRLVCAAYGDVEGVGRIQCQRFLDKEIFSCR